MEYDWAEDWRRLQGNTTPHFDYWRCEICGDNHPTDYCQYNYNSGWKNYQNSPWYNNPPEPNCQNYPWNYNDTPTYRPEPNCQTSSWYNNEIPAYSHEPYYPYNPSEPYEFSLYPQPSAEDLLRSELKDIYIMIKDQNERFEAIHEKLQASEARLKNQSIMLERLQAEAQLNNQSITPQEIPSNNIIEILWDQDDLSENEEIHWTQEEKDELSREIQLLDKLYNQRKVVMEPELENAAEIEEKEVVMEPETEKAESEEKDEQIWDLMKNEEIQGYTTEENQEQEEKHEQIWEHIEKPEIPEEIPAQHGVVNLFETAQKIDRMVLPFQVKHPTRPPDCKLIHLILQLWNEVARTLKSKNFYLPPQLWNEWIKRNAHNAVPTRASKATVKPP